MSWPNQFYDERGTFTRGTRTFRVPRVKYLKPPPPREVARAVARAGGFAVRGVARKIPGFYLGLIIAGWHRQLGNADPAVQWQADGFYLHAECLQPRVPMMVGTHVQAQNCATYASDRTESGPALQDGYSVYEVLDGASRPWRVKYEYRLLSGQPEKSWDELVEELPKPAGKTQLVPQPGRYADFYPGFYPPLVNPPFLAPGPVRPGRYRAPKRIMPEWPETGYGDVRRPPVNNDLKSEPPPRGTRERKVRVRDYAIGRTIEWLVSQATEGLDFQRALFEALPWWRKIALYKKARRLELQYEAGRIVRGRLHYVDLTPQAKMQAIYDYVDEIDVAQAVENVIKQQLTDLFWAEIGNRMGRYQVGPWDDHGYRGPEPEPEWEWYVPDTAPDTTHNHWTYETLVDRRLTRQEAERIHTRYDQYRSQLYEG